ncbi:MAG: aldolase/citrate lyase family protein [Chloroflexota bacterium]
MRINTVRQKVRDGKPTIGTFMGLGSPNVAELLAHAGFDWLVIETEHNALDVAQVEHMLMAMNGTETIPLVRVPSSDQVFIQRALDIGGMGIVVPMVKTAAEAQTIVRATRYPSQGTRSFGALRASNYTHDYETYFNQANDNILVVLIVETREAVENLDAIAAVPGVDVLFFGMFDLCLAYGLNPFEMPFPEIDAIVERAIAISQQTDVAVGFGASTPEEQQQRAKQGITFLSYGTDYNLLVEAAQNGIQAFKE